MRRKLPWARSALTHGALIGTAALLVLLGFEHRALDADYRDYRQRHDHPQMGEYVPSVQGTSLKGTPMLLGPGAKTERQVLFIFDTTCPFCRASLAGWKEIAVRLEQDGTARAYGISLDPVGESQAYAAEHELPFPVIPVERQRFVGYYRTKVVPLTLVIDSSGYVLFARSQGLESGTAAVDSILAAVRRKDDDRS